MKTPPLTPRRLLAALSLALGAAAVLPAMAAPGAGHGMPMAHGAGGAMFGGLSPRMLERVNATPEQRTQIEQILKAGADERRAHHEAARALREQAMALFAQPTVDANAAEALRQKQLALQDAGSKRLTAAMLDISRELTPEQRKQMADSMSQRREMMQRHQQERRSIDAPKS